MHEFRRSAWGTAQLLLVLAAAAFAIACSPPTLREGNRTSAGAPSAVSTPRDDSRSGTTPGPLATGSDRGEGRDDAEPLDGGPLDPVDPDMLPPLSDDEWADPEAVAVRAVLVLTNHGFDEPAGTVTSRLAPYCTALFSAEFAASNTGTAGADALASEHAVAVGHVSGTTVSNNDGHTATVTVWAAAGVATGSEPDTPLEPDPYRVLLARQPDGRWLVAGLTP